jgi:hypothetical protein
MVRTHKYANNFRLLRHTGCAAHGTFRHLSFAQFAVVNPQPTLETNANKTTFGDFYYRISKPY